MDRGFSEARRAVRPGSFLTVEWSNGRVVVPPNKGQPEPAKRKRNKKQRHWLTFYNNRIKIYRHIQDQNSEVNNIAYNMKYCTWGGL